MNFDQFHERAAIREYDGGETRFAAETAAAAEQGCKRHEVLDAIRAGHSSQARDHGAADARGAARDLPAMQRAAQEENRPMPRRGVQA